MNKKSTLLWMIILLVGSLAIIYMGSWLIIKLLLML